VAPILLIFLRIKLTRVYACHFFLIIFLTGGVHTPYILTLYVYATGSNAPSQNSTHVTN